MGLPGSGKTTLAKKLIQNLKSVDHFNADEVRSQFNDWDFTEQGRIRQAYRMAWLSDNSTKKFIVCDFVAPTDTTRSIFSADFTIWIDTIKEGRFDNTNKTFTPPSNYDIRITDYKYSIDDIINKLI